MLSLTLVLATLVAAPADLPIIQARLIGKFTDLEELDVALGDTGADGECFCGAWQVTASSALKPNLKASYEVGRLRDHRAETAWCEGVAGFGEGQTLTLKLDDATDHPIWRGGVSIVNGYQANEVLRRHNGRIKTLKAYVNGAPVALVELRDEAGQQSFALNSALPKGVSMRGATIKLEIVAVFTDGTTAQDTCVSELNPSECCR